MVLYCTSYMNASLLYNLVELEYGGCMPYINKFYFYNSNTDNVTCVHESLTTSLRYHHNLQQQWQLIAQQRGSMDGLEIMMYGMLLHYFILLYSHTSSGCGCTTARPPTPYQSPHHHLDHSMYVNGVYSHTASQLLFISKLQKCTSTCPRECMNGWSLYHSRSLLYHLSSLLLSMSPPITSHLWSYHWHRAGWSTKQQCHVRMKWWMHKDTVCVLRLSMYKIPMSSR